MKKRAPNYQKERGERQRQKIVFAIFDGMLSAAEIANMVCLTVSAIHLHLAKMRRDKLVRIAGFREQSRAREIPLYGLGSEPDVVYTCVRARGDMYSRRKAMFQRILSTLNECRANGKSATGPELALLLGVSNPTMRKYLPLMRKENLIYRSGWIKREGGGDDVAVWAVGNKPDAPKHSTAHRRRASPLSEEQRELIHRRREARQIIRQLSKKPNGIFGALGI